MPLRDPDCIFCKIVAGEVPSEKVFENEDVLAFLDVQPTAKGHTLVVPKAHHSDLLTTPPDVLARILQALPVISRAVVHATEAEGFNVLQSNSPCAGQAVFHIHFHIVPRRSGDGIGLGFRQAPAATDDLSRTGAAIRAAF